MNRARPRTCALTAGLVTLALGGCAVLYPQPFGEAAPDADPVRADGGPVRMAPNAPSILNGHWEAGEGHQGIDILGPVGTPVLAPAPGRVSDSWFGPMYGHQILIDHAPGFDEAIEYVSVQSALVRSWESGSWEQVGSVRLP